MPRPPHSANASRDAAEALGAVAPLATRWIERLLAAHEPPLTVTQYLALRAIQREGVSTGELARRAGVSGPAASQLVASLADAGMVERQPVREDRRRLKLALSARGRRAFRSAERLLQRGLAELIGDIPKPEASALAHALPRVEAALAGSPPPRRPPPLPPRGPGPPGGPGRR